MKGFNRRASYSSGEAKIDLKLAWPGNSESSFNYHVRVQEDPAIEAARKAQSAADKKTAEEFKVEKAKEDKVKKEAADKVTEALKTKAARDKILNAKANEAWNKLGKPGQKGKTEKSWKEQWIKDNEKRIK